MCKISKKRKCIQLLQFSTTYKRLTILGFIKNYSYLIFIVHSVKVIVFVPILCAKYLW